MPEYQSESEKNGMAYLTDADINVLSVGISTGGSAEIKMAQQLTDRHIIATSIDRVGLEETRKLVEATGMTNQITVKYEDVSEVLPYEDGYFDYIYARLVLHYLSKEKLSSALQELYRVTKKNGRIFVVVRSTDSDEAKQADNIYDEETVFTTYTTVGGHTATRYFHTVESISDAIESEGWKIKAVKQYDEMLNADFDRKGLWVKNNVIELLAEKSEQ